MLTETLLFRLPISKDCLPIGLVSEPLSLIPEQLPVYFRIPVTGKNLLLILIKAVISSSVLLLPLQHILIQAMIMLCSTSEIFSILNLLCGIILLAGVTSLELLAMP